MAYASESDVQAVLDPDPDKLLKQVEAILKSRIPDLDERVEKDEDYRERVIAVEASAVARIMRNPEGLMQESEGNYTVMLQSSAASGQMLITDEEWRWLGVGAGVSTVSPDLGFSNRKGCSYTWCWEWNCQCRF